MERVFTWASILTAFLAALLWFWSAMVPIPQKIDMLWSGEASHFIGALQHGSMLSGWAAISTGVSVLCQAVATILKRF